MRAVSYTHLDVYKRQIEFYKFGAFDSLVNAVRELITEVNSFRFSKDQSAKDTGGRDDKE